MICNGIDTDQLHAFGTQLVERPAAAAASLAIRTRWTDRYGTTSTGEDITVGGQRFPREVAVAADRPAALGGGDDGPAPGELLLIALGSCVAQAFVEVAALQGIGLDEVDVRVEAGLDLRGNLGVEGVRPGLAHIHLDVEVASAALGELLDGLLDDSVRRSPIADSLTPESASLRPLARLRRWTSVEIPGPERQGDGGLVDVWVCLRCRPV